MKYYYYAHTGHRIGLDRFRRAAAILPYLDQEVTLLTSDFRVASILRDYHIKKNIGLDVVRNIPQVAHNGDKIIFDSDEFNEFMLEDMQNFFSTFIRVSDKVDETLHESEYLINPYIKDKKVLNEIIVDPSYFKNYEKNKKIGFFFGDDDYEEDLLKIAPSLKKFNFDLLLGFYWFLEYEDKLSTHFNNLIESEDYQDFISTYETIISSSPQAILDALASGSKVIYIQRDDYPKDFLQLFKELNIPTLTTFDQKLLEEAIELSKTNKYHKLPQNHQKIISFINSALI